MAKVNDLKKGLGNIKKKPILTEKETEPIVKKVHGQTVAAPKKRRGAKKKNIEETTRYTVDIPNTVYKALKHRLADEGGTMKSVIIRLLKKELGIKD